jgi:phage terminase small subunit
LALTPKQQAFADYYLETGNATEAAKRAGYSESTAQQIGSENLSKPLISAYIQERLEQIKSKNIATIDEVMSFYTKVMRGEEKDQFGLDASLTDRIKAGQELVKRLSASSEADKSRANENMTALADLIRNPQPNRDIASFEGEQDE